MSTPIEAIERTMEYETFMKELRNFHDRKGTVLQAEPVLGGKKLDLLRIYKTVVDAGGYEKVTLNRGWKQVGDPFNFPPTCTNSAFILKAVYTKYLHGYEEENYWKRPWNPPPELLHSNQKAGPPPISSSSPSSISNGPTQQREAVRQTGTAFTQPSAVPRQPQNIHLQQINGPYHPHAMFTDHEFRTRILLSLQSSLPNEVDWAFNTLIKFSYASENFCLDFIPTLIQLLLSFTVDFFKTKIGGDNDPPPQVDIFCSKDNQESYERVLQVFHILRNFSFLEMNIRRLASHEQLRFLLMKSIALSPNSPYSELSRHCLDILENIAPQIMLVSRSDPYVLAMTRLLFTNDRAFILGAIRSLTRVAVTETNERILATADKETIERMAQFLIVDDEELEAATLEYLYQYSSLRGNFSTQLIQHYPGNLIGLLTGFISYKSSLVPPTSSAINTIHGIPAAQLILPESSQQQPSIPDLTDYAHLDEPYRCLGWLKDQLLSGTDENTILFKDLFNEYQKLFGTEKPLGIKEFYTVLKIAFPQPPAVEMAVTVGETPLETVLQNVRYSPTRRRDGPICHWIDCNQVFDTSIQLHKHIIQDHLTVDECQWMKCSKPLTSKSQAIHHMRTHFVGKIHKKKQQQQQQLQLTNKKMFAVAKIPIDDSEVSGIPLTSALLLRNLVRHKQYHSYYFPYEAELALLAIQRPKISKYILTVLNELQVN